MGETAGLGIVLGVLAFLVGGALWYQAFGMANSFMAGLIAGGGVFGYFYWLDQKQLKDLLNPAEQVWPVPFQIAWGVILDVLKRSGVQTGVSGTSNWHVTQEDDSRGLIEARLSFQQMLGAGANARAFMREIALSIKLEPDGDKTKVKLNYQIQSESGTGMVRQLISKNQKDFQVHAIAQKEFGAN